MTVKPYLFTITAIAVLAIIVSGCKKGSNDLASGKPTPTPTPAVDPKDVYISQLNKNINVESSRSANSKEKELIDGQIAILADVNGGTLRGEGGIYRNLGIYSVYAKAKLDKPKNNEFYQGWVTNTQTKEYFSIGKMESDSIGQYNTSYNTDNIHSGFDRIVITLETKEDNTPEQHILEGTISNILEPGESANN